MGIVHAQGRGFMMGLVVYFGFFTVLTNLLAALVITGHAAGPRTPTCKSAASPVVMTTTTAAITMPGAVYFFNSSPHVEARRSPILGRRSAALRGAHAGGGVLGLDHACSFSTLEKRAMAVCLPAGVSGLCFCAG